MGKMNLFLVIASLVILTGATAWSAEDLPPDSIGADTVFVIHGDAKHLAPDLVRKAVFSVLGDNAERADDFIAKFQDRYNKATKAGLESITVVGTSGQRVADAGDELGANPNASKRRRMLNPPVVYYHVRADADVKIIEDAMMQDMPDKQKEDVRFEQEGDWIVMHQKDQTPPEKVDAERARAFADALASIPDAAIGLVIIPDERSKAEMGKSAARGTTPKLLKSALPVLSESKWIAVSIALGNDPGLTVTANTADTKSAQTLRDSVETALNDLKEKFANPADSSGPMQLIIGPVINPLVDGLRPVTRGTNVTCSLKGEPLNSLANMVMTIHQMTQPPATEPAAGK